MAAADQVSVKFLNEGMSAVFLVDTKSIKESREIKNIFKDLAGVLRVRQVCSGKLLGYAVMADKNDSAIIDDIEDILRNSFNLILAQRSLDNITFHIVKELCAGIKGKLMTLPHCNLCGKTIPFPAAELNIKDKSGSVLVTRNYCTGCIGKFYNGSQNCLIDTLAKADHKGLALLTRTNLVRIKALQVPTWYAVMPDSEVAVAGISR
ncbi:MAG: hypothetical protein SNJ70_09175 [Armatimonadota bacterium]